MNTVRPPRPYIKVTEEIGVGDRWVSTTTTTPVQADPLMTVEEVAKYLRMSAGWVRQHSSGERQPTLPRLKLGGAVRFRQSAVEKFLAEMAEGC